jgi:SPP1 gp7 family putative phage head morphogenesis protein
VALASLPDFAAQHPHTARLRKRQLRQMRAIYASKSAERWYRHKLLLIAAELKKAGGDLADDMKSVWPEPQPAVDGAGARARDAQAPNIDADIAKLAERFGNIQGVSRRLAALAALKNRGEVDLRLAKAIKRSMGVDVSILLTGEGEIALAMESAIAANVSLITSIPSQYFDKLKAVVTNAWRDGLRHEELVSRIARLGNVTDSRAKLIARDQTSKMNSSFNEVRQTSLGIERYTWSTARDERVRPEHARLNGQSFAWKSPPFIEGEAANPGQQINCRCVALPIVNLDDLPLEAPPAERAAA